MAEGVEEEEFGSHRCLGQHDNTRSYHRKKADDVQDTNAVEYDIARPGQRFLRERHLGCASVGSRSSGSEFVGDIL